MKIAVLSGKGGAGKTMVAANLAAVAKNSAYIDCDVEEPNGRLFFKPDNVESIEVNTLLPDFDSAKCIGCRKCVDFCRFNALIYISEKPRLFPEVCHSCGGCQMVCPSGAISEKSKPVGHIEQGWHGDVRVITGILNTGEASGIPVIKALDKAAEESEKDLIIKDCPPGSACSVMESIADADYCILVAEPTAFGFHNFCMVHQLVSLMGKPCGVVINKQDTAFEPLEDFCKENDLPVLARIPYSHKTAEIAAAGGLVSEKDEDTAQIFRDILRKTGGNAQ